MSGNWWEIAKGFDLAQGDLLPDCSFPMFSCDEITQEGTQNVELKNSDLIVVSQTCDLVNKKLEFIALCAVNSVVKFKDVYQNNSGKDKLNGIRQSKQPAFHMLSSPGNPTNNQQALIVDFGYIISLPLVYIHRGI